MITQTADFIGEIYIPNLRPTGPGLENTSQNSKIDQFINQYETECLNKTLGHTLAETLKGFIDDSGAITGSADQKWKDLYTGASYEIDGQKLYWEGLKPSKLIPHFVFFYFIQDQTYSGVGVVQEKPKNAEVVSIVPKAVRAWRRFYALTVGNVVSPIIYETAFGVGVDWLGVTSPKRSLYQFITDKNRASETYPDWEPYPFKNINEFGI